MPPPPLSESLGRARELYDGRAWADAHAALARLDRATPLGPDDLERLAVAAYLIGQDDEFVAALDRAHHAHLAAGAAERAARCAFWSCLNLLLRGETGRASGWLARMQRLLEGHDCAEQGYLLLPAVEQQLAAGDRDAAYATAAHAASIGQRFDEPDLIAAARHLQGRALIGQGQLHAGLALLDEAMIAVTGGELSPIMTGLVYCSVIDACQHACALARAREWTSALAAWCDTQPQMVAFTATCLVRRAEILQRSGAWPDAIEEARRASTRPRPPAAAFYQQGEVHRLRGELAAAEAAYRQASLAGWDPQPGLCLLWLEQGRTADADAAMRRLLRATPEPLHRVKLLPAHVEIMLRVGDIEEARRACRELDDIAERFQTGALGAMAAHAGGAVSLAEGDAAAALETLRHAWQAWQDMEAPYDAARARELLGIACRAVGDAEGGRLELEAARAVFERLGAAPDVARIDRVFAAAPAARQGPLTARELEVLRLVAAGKTNKAIAAALRLSRKTVDRHVSNIFVKLNVSSRAAATAYAYEHGLI